MTLSTGSVGEFLNLEALRMMAFQSGDHHLEGTNFLIMEQSNSSIPSTPPNLSLPPRNAELAIRARLPNDQLALPIPNPLLHLAPELRQEVTRPS